MYRCIENVKNSKIANRRYFFELESINAICVVYSLQPVVTGTIKPSLSTDSTLPTKYRENSKIPTVFFAVDLLPSKTNLNKNEPEYIKNRSRDVLCPAMFFFEVC